MANLAESGATLVVAGEGLDAAALSRRLGIGPGAAAAPSVALPDGWRLTVEPGRWALRAPSRRPGDPDAQIAALLARIRPDPDAWQDLTAHHALTLQLTLYLDALTEETALAPETLALLAARGIALRLEIFAMFTAAGSCGG